MFCVIKTSIWWGISNFYMARKVISEKFHWKYMVSKHWKRQTLSALIFVNTAQYPRTLRNNIHHSKKQGPQSFFHTDTNPVTTHTLVHSVDKTHGFCSFNFVPAPGKSHRFTRALTKLHCFFGWCVLFKVATVLFLQLFFLNDSAFALLSTPVVRMLLTPSWVGRWTDVKEL